MKGNKKILAVAVLLLLIAVGYGTYAIYRESAEGAATINAAAWSVKIGNDDFKDVDFDFTLADMTCSNNPGKAGTIAPGAECYIDYNIDADGSQVDVVIEVDDDNSTVPEPLTVTVGTTTTPGSVTIPYSATEGEMEETVRLTVKWPGALTDDTTKDTTDLDLNGDPLSFNVKLVARQALS